jgi:hypothetical protein
MVSINAEILLVIGVILLTIGFLVWLLLDMMQSLSSDEHFRKSPFVRASPVTPFTHPELCREEKW